MLRVMHNHLCSAKTSQTALIVTLYYLNHSSHEVHNATTANSKIFDNVTKARFHTYIRGSESNVSNHPKKLSTIRWDTLDIDMDAHADQQEQTSI